MQDQIVSSFSRFNWNRESRAITKSPASVDDEANSFTQSMLQRRIQDRDEAAESSRTVAMVNSLKRFRQIMFVGGDNQSAAAILEICKFTREASDVCINPVRTCD